MTLCKLPTGLRGASWGADGSILFGAAGSGLWRVSAAGGDAEPVTTLDAGEFEHQRPAIVSSGKAALFTVWSGSPDTARIDVLSLETGAQRALLAGTNPRYASTSHIVFWQAGSLWAVLFDLDRLDTTSTCNVHVPAGLKTRGYGCWVCPRV